MKKVLFSVLMISALFVFASCGSKSSSGEVAEEATEEESVAKVEFADPAIVYQDGIDLTSYFSPVSVSQPTLFEDKTTGNYYHLLSINVKLKVNKKPNLKGTEKLAEEYPDIWGPKVIFSVKFCDQSGSMIAKGYCRKNGKEISEGSIISMDIKSDRENGDLGLEDAEKKLAKVRTIEVGISTDRAELINDGE